MKKSNILILYKNKDFKIFSYNKLKKSQLLSNNIRTIFIPLYDNPNAYIPIKPSVLYEFKKATVLLRYQAFMYDYEEELGTSFDLQEAYFECANVIELINALYNLYKFRGVTLYMENSYQITSNLSSNFVMVPRRILIKFYDENNELIKELDSGNMVDLEEYDIEVFRRTPPAYICENRMNSIKDMLYVPEIIDKNCAEDVSNLPLCIKLSNDNTWKTIKRPGNELLTTDYILYKIPDFEIYYLMEYGLYLEIITFKKFEIHYICTPIDTSVMDTDYLQSIDRNKVPSIFEKMEACEAFCNSELYSIVNAEASIYSIDTFLQSLIFFNTIMNYIRYFGLYCYAGNSTALKIRTFALFCRYNNTLSNIYDQEILTDIELDYESINQLFLKMIMKGKR